MAKILVKQVRSKINCPADQKENISCFRFKKNK